MEYTRSITESKEGGTMERRQVEPYNRDRFNIQLAEMTYIELCEAYISIKNRIKYEEEFRRSSYNAKSKMQECC